MPSTCLVEVESSKTLENAALHHPGKTRFFELLPQLAKLGEVRIYFYG